MFWCSPISMMSIENWPDLTRERILVAKSDGLAELVTAARMGARDVIGALYERTPDSSCHSCFAALYLGYPYS